MDTARITNPQRRMIAKLRKLTGIPTVYRFIPRFRWSKWGETDTKRLYAVQPVCRDWKGNDDLLETWELWEIWDDVPEWAWKALDAASEN